MKNPYGANIEKWAAITERLLQDFPVKMDELVKVVLSSWEDIFHSKIGARSYQIGRDIWPEPQIMGFLMHELVPLNLAATYPRKWRRCMAGGECDAVYLLDDDWSFEIKTSSSRKGIFGNRSHAQVSEASKKRRGSFFLAINFGKFGTENVRPEISLIRFGWLGASDWIGQRAQSGQQAHLTKEARAYKLKIIYEQLLE
ncbi:MAG TPA: ScaI family restriction endonuclease [Tepidisphaeraceae bacterium]|nr:ScaI family restriction endonuclease [Tepidisphaeraceae bacterium]